MCRVYTSVVGLNSFARQDCWSQRAVSSHSKEALCGAAFERKVFQTSLVQNFIKGASSHFRI